MAAYTIELKDVVSNGHKIFDFKYPFYDDLKRPAFEEHFIKHFYFREIGCETVDRFKFYLEDKMNTVFPYYNELLKTTTIEYDILNNYKLTEEFESSIKNEGSTAGVSSTRGKLTGTQESETQNDRTTDKEGNSESRNAENETVSETVTTEKTGTTAGTSSNTENVKTNRSESVEGATANTSEETATGTKHTVTKFLDTPQGLTDLSNAKYLTTLTDVSDTDTQSRERSESGTNEQTTATKEDVEKTSEGANSSESSENGTTTNARTTERSSESANEMTDKETVNDHVVGTVKDEQESLQDNNTRMYTDNVHTEKNKLTRIGSIGIVTGSDMIEKHIRLQKTLQQIELLFFNECEDLFMMVY